MDPPGKRPAQLQNAPDGAKVAPRYGERSAPAARSVLWGYCDMAHRNSGMAIHLEENDQNNLRRLASFAKVGKFFALFGSPKIGPQFYPPAGGVGWGRAGTIGNIKGPFYLSQPMGHAYVNHMSLCGRVLPIPFHL